MPSSNRAGKDVYILCAIQKLSNGIIQARFLNFVQLFVIREAVPRVTRVRELQLLQSFVIRLIARLMPRSVDFLFAVPSVYHRCSRVLYSSSTAHPLLAYSVKQHG